jgi:UDP-N-acetylglucosamine 2-epimerase
MTITQTPRMKVTTVVGTRPEIIRLSRVLAKLDIFCDHTLVHTGQNYDHELNTIFFDELGLRAPDHVLNVAGQSAAETIGNVIAATDKVLAQINPDAVLILGDTNSCMAALSAKRRKIPVFHMEAGNRCFDQRVPEEINRKIVDHISDINLTYSTIARDYLLREGLSPDRVIKTGSPMFEVLNYYKADIERSQVLNRQSLSKNQYFIVSAHREENIEPEPMVRKLADTLNQIAAHYDRPVIVSTHPRTRKRFEALDLSFHDHVKLLKPLGFFDYVHMQKNAKAVLSDSGTISEESSILGFPALTLREAHERPEGMEEASVLMTGLNPQRVMQGLALLDAQHDSHPSLLRPVADYSMPNVSDKVVRLILSYTDYVNRVVWQKG